MDEPVIYLKDLKSDTPTVNTAKLKSDTPEIDITSLTPDDSSSKPRAAVSEHWYDPAIETTKEMAKSVLRGGENLGAIGGGLIKWAGDVTGIEPISEAGETVRGYYSEKAQANKAAVPSYTDIKSVEDAAKYLAGGFGEMVPMFVPGMGGAYAGGRMAVRSAISGLEKAGVVDLLAPAAAKTIQKAATKGTIAGAATSSYGIELGSIYSDQAEQGAKKPWKAAGYAVPAAALDSVGELLVFAKIPAFKALQELPLLKTAEGRNWFIRGAKEALKGGSVEGLTEFAQTIIERGGAEKEMFNKEAFEEALNGAIIGVFTGGVMSGTGGALSKPAKKTVEYDHDLLNPRAERNTPERNELAQALRAARNQPQGVTDERQNADVRDEGNNAEVLPEMQSPDAGGLADVSGVRDANVTQADIDLAAEQKQNELYRQQRLMDRADIPEIQPKPEPTPEEEIAGLDEILVQSKDSLLALHQQIASGQLDAEQMKGAKQEIRNLNDRMKSAEKARELLAERLPPTRGEVKGREVTDYSVDTEDNGTFSSRVMRHADGSATIFDDVSTIDYPKEFSSDKTNEQLLAYTYEPLGYKGAANDSQIGQGVSRPVGIGEEPGGAVSDQSGSGSATQASGDILAAGPAEATAPVEASTTAEAAPAETVAEVKPITEADIQKMNRRLVSAQSKGNTSKVKELKAQISAAKKTLAEQKKAEKEAQSTVKVLPLTASQRRSLEDVRNEIAEGRAGRKFATVLDTGDMVGGYEGSSYPGYFKDKGYTKKEALTAIDKALKGEKLTEKQTAMVQDLNSGRRNEIADYLRKGRKEAIVNLDEEQLAAYDDISELVYEYEFDENAFDEVASFFDDLIAENKNENTERANQEKAGEVATGEKTTGDRGAEEVARTEPAKAEATDDAGGLKQTVALEGDKKAPVIGGVQKQGGRKVGTSELMDGFTPEPPALFSLSKPSPFFSKAEELVNAKMDNKMPVIQLLNMLKKNGATDAEIDNALGGIRDKGGIVSKAEVLDELKANSVEFQDVILGNGKNQNDNRFAVRGEDDEVYYYRNRDEAIREAVASDMFDDEEMAAEWVDEQYVKPSETPETFFSQYTEPGAVEGSYREMFVTAPTPPPSFAEWLSSRPPTTARLPKAQQELMYADSIKNNYHGWQDGHSQYSDIQNPIVRIRFNTREGSPLNVNPAVRIQKIDAIRESLKNLAGSKAAFQSAFQGVEGVVESAVNHYQVRQKVISLIPINVVNKLKALQLSPQDLFSGKAVSANDASLLLDSRADVVAGVKSALEKTGATMRTEIMRHSLAGLDGDVLPALRASDLNRDEVRMILSPEFVDSGHMGEKSTSLSGTRDRTTLPVAGRSSVENGSANLARDMRHDTNSLEDVIKKHGELVKHKQGINARAKILMVEEIQGPSDANQQKMPDYLRKRIYDIGVKRVLAYAKENGFDGISWTTGEMQAKRYDLSKQVDEIEAGVNSNGTYDLVIDFKEHGRQTKRNLTVQELEDNVGKELAKKIVDDGERWTAANKVYRDAIKKTDGSVSEAEYDKLRSNVDAIPMTYSGLDLKVGGEGLKKLYDVTLPALFKKYGKEKAEGQIEVTDKEGQVHQIDVTPITQNTPASYAKYSDKGQKSGLLNVIVKKELAPLINRLKDTYSVEVVQSERELRPELQAQIKSENVAGQVEGLYDPKSNKVILVADNLKDLTRAQEVLKHELVHKGISSVFGNRLNIYLDMIKSERGLSSRRAAEEFIAEHGEKYAGQGAVKRFIAAARQMLRDMGFKVKFSDADILSIAGKSIAATEKTVAVHADGTRFAVGKKDSALDRRIELMRELDKVKQELFGGTSERVVNVKSVSQADQQEVQGRDEDTRGNQAREIFESVSYGNEALHLGSIANQLLEGVKAGQTTKPEAVTSFAQDLNAIAKESPESKQAILDTAAALRALGHDIPITIDRNFSAHLLEAIDEEYNYLRDTAMFSLKDKAKESSLSATKESGKIPAKEETDNDGYMREAERLTAYYDEAYPDRYSFKAVWPEGEQGRAATAIGRAFGKRVVFIEDVNDKTISFDGVVIDPETIFVNAKSPDPYVVTVGHELVHTLRRDNPSLYNDFVKTILPELKHLDKHRSELNKTRALQGLPDVSEGKAVEELLGDFIGERMLDKTFWNRLALRNPTIFQKVMTTLSNLWRKLAQYAGYSHLLVRDMEKAQAIAADVLSRYAGRKGTESAPANEPADYRFDLGKFKEAIGEKTMKEHAHNVLDRVRNVLDNPGGLGTLGNWKEYLAKRYKTLGTLSEIKDFTHDISKTFGKASEADRKAIFNYLTNKDGDASAISTHLREESVKMKQMIEDIGDKLVAYGVLPQEVIDANRGEYLPTVYLKHILGKETFQAAGSGKKLDLSYTKKKRLREDLRKQGLSEEEIDLFMRTQMGEIKDPAYLLAKAFSIPSRDMAIIDWLAQVSQKSEWVLPKSLVEWTHSDTPTRKVGSVEYKKNDDGTHDLKITKVKTVETKHTSTAAGLAKLLGNDKLADFIKAGKGKQQYRKDEVNGKEVLKPTPWKQVGHIQYKVSNGTYELKIKERVKKVDELKGVKDLTALVGEKKADQIMNDEGKALGGRMVTPFWLMAEAKRIEEMKPHLPESDRAEAQDVADRMKAKAREALEGVTVGKLPDDYRQMPDTPKYGALRGLIVRKEIFNDIVGNMNVTIGEKSLPEKILGTGGTVSKLTGMWKWAKVAANPPAQVRNIISNMVLLNLSGVPFYRVPIRVSQAIKEIKNNGKHWQIAKKYGVKEATFSNTEMARIDSDLIDMEARNAGKLSWVQAKSLVAKIVNMTGDAYQFMEAVGKTAKIIDEMENGKSAQDAAMEAHKFLFDYSLVGPGTKYLRNAPVGIPFITFMAKILPRLAEVAVTKPWRFTPYIAMAYGLQSLVAGMLGVDDDDLDKLKQALPKWIHEKQHVYFLPYKDDAGRWQAVDLGYFFPWTQWTEIAQNVAEGDMKGVLKQSGILGGPLPDLITAIKTNLDPFTQRPVVDKYADPPEQLAQIMGYLYQMAAPPWLTQRGTAGKIYSALSSEIDKQGQPKSTGKQAALSLAGVNLYAYDPALTRRQNIKRMDFEIGEVQRQAKSALQDKNLTPGEREKIREKFLARIQKMNREKIKYAAGSMPKDQSLLQR